MKKIVASILSAALALSLTACGGAAASTAESTAESAQSTAESALNAADTQAGGSYTVGILQYTSHTSLDEINAAIVADMEAEAAEQGFTITFDQQNAEQDAATMNSICQKFVSDDVDVIVAIATPAAMTAANAIEGTDIPLIFSAVTDPVGAGLVTDMDAPGGNITGTSDYCDPALLLEMATVINPDCQKIGILYDLGQDGTLATIEQAKSYLDGAGIAYVEQTATNSAEVQQATQALIAEGVDAIFAPQDNTIAGAMAAVADECNKAGIPTYLGADSMVKDGGFATKGVDYTNLGTVTGQMTVQVLQGAKAGELPVKVSSEGIVTVNTETAETLGVDYTPLGSDVVTVTTNAG